jgi:phage protein D
MGQANYSRLVPDCRVSVDGKKLPLHIEARLARLTVDLDAELYGSCVLVFHDPQLALINGKDFAAGAHVKVECGFARKLLTVFEGEVTALEPQFHRDVPPALRVVCLEPLHRLALSETTRALDDVDDKQVVSKIAQEHGLRGEAPAGTKEHSLQANVTDAVLLRRMAGKHGQQVRLEGTKLTLGPPPRREEIAVDPSSGLRKIRIRIDARGQLGEVTVHAWDPKTKKEVVATAKPQGAVGEGARKHGGSHALAIAGHEPIPADTASAEAMAKGRIRKLAEKFVTAQVEMIGDARALPGATLKLEKLEAGVDGTYRIDHARHEFSRHGYFMKLDAVRIAKKKLPAPVKGPAEKPAKEWLELELVDDAGKPMAGQRYRVQTADGRVVEGKLDASGKARLTDVKPGSNTVSFPDYSGEWRRT